MSCDSGLPEADKGTTTLTVDGEREKRVLPKCNCWCIMALLDARRADVEQNCAFQGMSLAEPLASCWTALRPNCFVWPFWRLKGFESLLGCLMCLRTSALSCRCRAHQEGSRHTAKNLRHPRGQVRWVVEFQAQALEVIISWNQTICGIHHGTGRLSAEGPSTSNLRWLREAS